MIYIYDRERDRLRERKFMQETVRQKIRELRDQNVHLTAMQKAGRNLVSIYPSMSNVSLYICDGGLPSQGKS